MITILKVLTSAVLVYIVYVVVRTSIESNLFELIKTWNATNEMAPWFSATLWDFYANVFFIFVWIAYKEQSVWRSALWLVLLTGLGSIATAAYFLIQLFRLKQGEGLTEVFIARRVS
jgi:hypothetical protein